MPQELVDEEMRQLCHKFLVEKNVRLRSIINGYCYHKYSIQELAEEARKINYTTKASNTVSTEETKNQDSFSVWDYMFFTRLRTPVYRFLGFFTLCFSCLIVIGELLILTNFDISFIRKMSQDSSFLRFLVTSMLPFYYLVIVVYWSYFNLKIEGYVGLHKKNTDAVSLLFYAQ